MLWETFILLILRNRLIGLNQIQSTYITHLIMEAKMFLRDTIEI